jgi:hypothetical protein
MNSTSSSNGALSLENSELPIIEVEVIKKSDTSTGSPFNSMEETNKEPFNIGDTI